MNIPGLNKMTVALVKTILIFSRMTTTKKHQRICELKQQHMLLPLHLFDGKR